MTLLFIRVLFLMIASFVGFFLGPSSINPLYGLAIGLVSGVILILLEMSLRRVSVRGLSSMVFGLLLGIILAKLVADTLSLLPLNETLLSTSRVVFTLVFSYLGAIMALRGKNEFHLIIPYVKFKRQEMDERVTLLDTSAIVDGRIVDLYKTNFFGGSILVPRFVLQELQKLSDSESAFKRQKGRRGMEILRGMQKNSKMDVKIHEEDIPREEEVDAKLVKLAKIMDARIFTTDYNLSRIAAIQGIEVLNVNELVNAVKPIFFQEDELEVRLVKEGKEPDQAIAYTNDGTMIVVNGAKELIGENVNIVISSVLQTQAGKMIFGNLKNNNK